MNTYQTKPFFNLRKLPEVELKKVYESKSQQKSVVEDRRLEKRAGSLISFIAVFLIAHGRWSPVGEEAFNMSELYFRLVLTCEI